MFFTIIAFTLLISVNAEDSPIVQTIYGPVVGLKAISRSGLDYYSYRGIPYAKAPIGKLRFKSPERPDNWTEVYDARNDGPKCIQKIWYSRLENPPIEGVEDCLFINIYTRSLRLNGNYNVMVYIHQGGFTLGSGQSTNIGPDYIMDEEIILVTFNYRLAIFGFYSTVDDASPGNYGYKDMVFALRWVQANIQYFGGDKGKVTVFGQSAGGVSVHHLILSPLGKNLFQRAISESGTALDIWGYAFNDLQKEISVQQAEFVNCTTDTSFAMVECLRQIPADVLVESAHGFNYFSVEPTTIFTTVTEVQSPLNPEPFITQQPMQTILSGEFNQVPWITGITSDEGIVKTASLVRKPGILQKLNENFDTLFPNLISLPSSVEGADEEALLNDIIQFYFDGQHFVNVSNPWSVQQLINLYTDRAFTYGVYQSVYLQSLKSLNPIWLYNFNYRGRLSYGDLFAATNENIDFKWGVSHCDELLYLFTTPDSFPPLPSEDHKISALMVKLWTNFAKFGEPRLELDGKCGPFYWPPIAKLPLPQYGRASFLNITKDNECRVKFKVEHEFYPERIRFWESQQSILENRFISHV